MRVRFRQHCQLTHFDFPVNNVNLIMTQFNSEDITTVEDESAKQKFPCYHDRETHGLHSGIDENTSMHDVKAPNVFERAKEEFQAIAQVFHHKKKDSICDIRDENRLAESKGKQEVQSSPSSETKVKAGNIFVRAKEEIKGIIHHDKSQHHHHKETHGRNDDINENTPTNEVKGPNVFERVREEFEAVFQAIHPKKES